MGGWHNQAVRTRVLPPLLLFCLPPPTRSDPRGIPSFLHPSSPTAFPSSCRGPLGLEALAS